MKDVQPLRWIASRPLYAGLALVGIAVLVIHSATSSDNNGASRFMGTSNQQACHLEFLRYEPSKWEQKWRANADEWGSKGQICSNMRKDKDLADQWMIEMPAVFSGDTPAVSMEALKDSDVWSHYVYKDGCNGNKEILVPIEPLVGLLRHPGVRTDSPLCKGNSRSRYVDKAHNAPKPMAPYDMENKGYMVLQPYRRDMVDRMYPGRKYLFDLGTGRYSSGSLPWFFEMYGRQGIVFDEVFGWEVKNIPQEEYWKDFPADISEKMHFRNIPCSSDPDAPDNPLNIIRRLYQPGDFVVFKLDIDTETIEQELMNQLDEDLYSKIAVFFFEQHFDAQEMHPHFHLGLKTTFADTTEMFHKHRAAGLRLHYWP